MYRYVRSARLWPLQAMVLLALLARVVVPPGYMLATADAGAAAWVKVVLCSAHGPIDVFVDPVTYEITDKPPLPARKPDDRDPPCVFATLAKLALPALPLELGSVQIAEAAAPLFVFYGNPERALSAPPPPATGPPHHRV